MENIVFFFWLTLISVIFAVFQSYISTRRIGMRQKKATARNATRLWHETFKKRKHHVRRHTDDEQRLCRQH